MADLAAGCVVDDPLWLKRLSPWTPVESYPGEIRTDRRIRVNAFRQTRAFVFMRDGRSQWRAGDSGAQDGTEVDADAYLLSKGYTLG